MFNDLFLLEKVRTKKEALGFYFAYFLLLLLIGGLLAAGLTDPLGSVEEGVQRGQIVGYYFGVVACVLLSFLVLYKKGQLNSFGLILIALLSGLGVLVLGGLLGLIPAAYLTTKENKNTVCES